MLQDRMKSYNFSLSQTWLFSPYFLLFLISFPITTLSVLPLGDPLQFPGDSGGAREADVQCTSWRYGWLVWFPSGLPPLPHPIRGNSPACVDGYLPWCFQGAPDKRGAQMRSGWEECVFSVWLPVESPWLLLNVTLTTTHYALFKERSAMRFRCCYSVLLCFHITGKTGLIFSINLKCKEKS